MKSLEDHCCHGIGDGTNIHHFLQGIRGTELEAVVNVVCAQLEKNRKDFDVTVSYLGQVVTKKGDEVQPICITETESQLVK